ncbi:MAG: hypothetical protein R3Y50_03075 [Rikenellaceae bacterium]
MYIETKPDYEKCLDRIEAWFKHEIIDRVPIRFHRHNAEYDNMLSNKVYPTLKEKWYDSEFQISSFLKSMKGMRYNGETFPVFMPNVGPDMFAACHGVELTFGEVTSWSEHFIHSSDDLSKIHFSKNSEYFQKIEEMTKMALEMSNHRFWTGYTDLHPGMDCAAAFRGPEPLCMDMIMEPELVKTLMKKSSEHFLEVYDHFDTMLKAHNQPSVTWMNIPIANGRMHIPSNDFSSMISPEMFEEFALPTLIEEVKTMTHNVFHVDGLGVANHTDTILSVEGIECVQWVQGMADLYPIMQHIPYIKHVQSLGASIIVDLDKSDLDRFMAEVNPKGIFLWIATENEEEELAILKKLMKWK